MGPEDRLLDRDARPDPDIARDAIAALRRNLPVASTNIRVSVQDGWIRLQGEVERNDERESAGKSVRRIKGVKGVSNLIQLEPKVRPSEAKRLIEEALRRNVDIDEKSIRIDAYNCTAFSKHRCAPGPSAKRSSGLPGKCRV